MGYARHRVLIGYDRHGNPKYTQISGKTQDERNDNIVKAYIRSGQIFKFMPHVEDKYILVDLLSDDNCILIDGNRVPYSIFNCLYEADMESLSKKSGSYDETYHMGRFNGMLCLASELCHVPVSDLKSVYFNLYNKKKAGEPVG